MSLIIKDKEGYSYIVWSSNRRAVEAFNEVCCNDVICSKKSCVGCVFALEIDNSYDRPLSDFEIVQM